MRGFFITCQSTSDCVQSLDISKQGTESDVNAVEQLPPSVFVPNDSSGSAPKTKPGSNITAYLAYRGFLPLKQHKLVAVVLGCVPLTTLVTRYFRPPTDQRRPAPVCL